MCVMCVPRGTVPMILHEMRSSTSQRVDLFGSFARFSNCFCQGATNARRQTQISMSLKRQTVSSSDKRANPEFDGGIRAHFTSKRNLKFLLRKRARKLSISRHWSSSRGASFFEMALNGRDLLTTKRFTTDTHPELHSARCQYLGIL